jgi:hypothetical protein
MMRMALIVVSLSTLTVIELVTPSRTKTNAPDPFDQLTVDVSVSPDTLEAADCIGLTRMTHTDFPWVASVSDHDGMFASPGSVN